VPRDIDPEINWLTNSYVYDIDDLKGVIDENIEDRQREARKGERIVDEAVIRFRDWYAGLDVVPTIIALRKKLEDIAAAEISKSFPSHKIPDQQADAVQKMTHSIIKKILHDPTLFLKENGIHDNKSLYIDIVRKLFKLDK
jgi:glutamyl-tRNA reductase